MTEPFRASVLGCPACSVKLRPFAGRLICDTCEGMFTSFADVERAIRELTGVQPVLEFHGDKPSERACPTCAAKMIACHLRVRLEDDTVKLKAELDRCLADGVWFDTEELAELLAVTR